MSYLEEIKKQLDRRNFPKLLTLWEEYCTNDTVDVEEFIKILELFRDSEFKDQLGKLPESALPVWQTIENKEDMYRVLRLLIDIQTTDSPILADSSYQALENIYGNHPHFKEFIRHVGLRSKTNFQGAISYFELLVHLDKGKFVYHTGGWGVGEVVDVSPIREQFTVEFEYPSGLKHFTFKNAFRNLMPLLENHFLAKRFADPDQFEKEARLDPVETIKILLRDLGPKTAAEIKDEMVDLVIPEKDWSRWWQQARAKLKKDTMIETPTNLKDPFRLRTEAVTHEEEMHQSIQKASSIDDITQTIYNYVRDFPALLKKEELKNTLEQKLEKLLDESEITPSQKLQIIIFLKQYFQVALEQFPVEKLIVEEKNIESIINQMDIAAFKKRALVLIRELREDWVSLFFKFFFSVNQNIIRDYILDELNTEETRSVLSNKLEDLLKHPAQHPEVFTWYFNKLLGKDHKNYLFGDTSGRFKFFEAFMVLFHKIEHKPESRDTLKKMYVQLSGKRFLLVRNMLKDASVEYTKEFLLLASKCHTLTDHDLKILHSLAEVVHPELRHQKKKHTSGDIDHVIWTTEEGYRKVQQRIERIGTVEIVENAREVEAARALGDLRENAEYKYAIEKRGRLQSELRSLSQQLNRARIITKEDIHQQEVGIGNIVTLESSKGENISYAILGPWDADPENNILSFQSKFAQSMTGLKVNDAFDFREDSFTIKSIKSYLDV